MNQAVALIEVDVSEFALDSPILVSGLFPENFLYLVSPVSWQVVARLLFIFIDNLLAWLFTLGR